MAKTTATETTIPPTSNKLPLVPFKVLAADIPFYRDPECADPVTDARLVVLQALDPDDQIQEYDIVPSTLQYCKGQYVTMALDNLKLWEDCFYKDPESGEIQKAWRIHVNFIGHVVDSEVVEKEREHLEDLERRVQDRIDEIARAGREQEVVN